MGIIQEMETELHGGYPILACGIDIVEIATFARSIQIGGKRFLQRVYTEAELSLCGNHLPLLATRFAGKEAIAKALGTGLRGISWREMEIMTNQQGYPVVSLYGRAAAHADQLHLSHWSLSLSHCPTFAVAVAFATGQRSAENTTMDKETM